MADSQVASAPASLNFDSECDNQQLLLSFAGLTLVRGLSHVVDAFYRNWVRTMHDVQLLGGDVSESEQQGLRAPTVPADALLKGLPSPEGLPPRPPWFACNGHFAPTGKLAPGILCRAVALF
jgi:hypothetical protein